MKRLLIIALLILGMFPVLRADEGMWLPLFVSRLNYVDMQKMGCTFRHKNFMINHSSMKDELYSLASDAGRNRIGRRPVADQRHCCTDPSIASSV